MWASVAVACGLSSCGSRALEHRLSSCGARALLLRSTWDLPAPGIKRVSPALADGFSTIAPPGKSDGGVTFHRGINGIDLSQPRTHMFDLCNASPFPILLHTFQDGSLSFQRRSRDGYDEG